MSCVSCGSSNLVEFPAEVNIHYAALTNLEGQPGMLVFPKLSVCLDCGLSEFYVVASELALLARGALTTGNSPAA